MQCGEILLLRELDSTIHLHRTVRLTGFISFLDCMQRYCIINHEDQQIAVDLEVVDLSNLKVETLHQFIGDINSSVRKV